MNSNGMDMTFDWMLCAKNRHFMGLNAPSYNVTRNWLIVTIHPVLDKDNYGTLG